MGRNRHQQPTKYMTSLDKKAAVSSSTATICSADGVDRNAERRTPDQRADAIIQVVYADTPPLWFELRDSIAAEIREAVEVERQICSMLANHFYKELEKSTFTANSLRESVAATVHACNGD